MSPVTTELSSAIADRLARMDEGRVLERIWARDHTVWKPDPAEISNRLGWLDVADAMRRHADELATFARRAASDGLETAVLLGMGGSSLAPEVLATTFRSAAGALELLVLDTTHPAAIERVTAGLDLDRTLFVAASKSGTTIETRSHLEHFWALAPDGGRFAAITDPGSPLGALARERGFRACFENPEDIGGRYSALSYFGLVPAALIGAPLDDLLGSAVAMAAASGPPGPAADSPGAALGAALGEAARAGLDKLTLVLPEEVASLGDWVEQLVAESTGKEGLGIVPIVGETLGDPDVYGADRLFVTSGEDDRLEALERAGHPVVRLPFAGMRGLGGEFVRWEVATAVAGHVLGINPFDQPNVQEAKDATAEVLSAGGVDAPTLDDPAALLSGVVPKDYVAILAYLDRTAETEASLEWARLAIRDRHRVATTLGFGPRFLHSTGQLHKGGPNEGVFLQVVDANRPVDVPVPGQTYSFGTLIDAQALGDLRALRERGRRVARVTLDTLTEVI
jgi:transaldolase / glucose-6-phosphate isomerase